ncbi:hypothetical protein [Chondromyces apiculatus]|uniref:hypothetical protein n=1 Tax=Chondromyces apiculatus TaxID=51 RepID=UPI0012DDF23F|nr:hypothetical protein [Chondromyces apiculatus]
MLAVQVQAPEGNHLWSEGFAPVTAGYIRRPGDIPVSADGEIAVLYCAGRFVAIGPGFEAGPDRLKRLDTSGNALWDLGSGSVHGNGGSAAFDGAGNILSPSPGSSSALPWERSASASCSSRRSAPPGASSGARRSAGRIPSTTRAGGSRGGLAGGLAVDASDHVFISGWFAEPMNLGLGMLPAGPFLARFTPGGAPVWVQSMPQRSRRLAVVATFAP